MSANVWEKEKEQIPAAMCPLSVSICLSLSVLKHGANPCKQHTVTSSGFLLIMDFAMCATTVCSLNLGVRVLEISEETSSLSNSMSNCGNILNPAGLHKCSIWPHRKPWGHSEGSHTVQTLCGHNHAVHSSISGSFSINQQNQDHWSHVVIFLLLFQDESFQD